MKNQSLPFWANAEAAEEDDAVRCESPRGGVGGRVKGWSKWREEGEEEEDEVEDEEEEAWREEEKEEEEGGGGGGKPACQSDRFASTCMIDTMNLPETLG
uniref:Uncharacterized protein n=1 Tax=Chromera velia CCMP2878 TaxID=1169474 RepID=A0A0G4I9P0_9ALVE|eukprot:Cvel_2052.t1-p1 / transcript=Cvel_2052.t1 / gene=Cvel_2052 / organism=Chromera_velia_CCMP2878 / gene_product=hypothetical protein / transcript_product=hypothetical protein / location=Cvel_scaffold79:4220-4516(+) / protein_length=99 / sequence_SO=supercontig / SO=protein_coding / is_pseudo=false